MISKRTPNGPGFVYLVRLDNFKNCYKIGSSSNIKKRMQHLNNSFNGATLLACKHSETKLITEWEIQNLLHKHSNNAIFAKCIFDGVPENKIIELLCAGHYISTEHFIFNDSDMQYVVSLFA